jgi:hypothetical protein
MVQARKKTVYCLISRNSRRIERILQIDADYPYQYCTSRTNPLGIQLETFNDLASLIAK